MEMYDIQNDYGYAYDGEGAYDYESDDYESDYDHGSDAGNDDVWGNRDDEYDSFLSRTCVSEKPSLDKVGGGMTVLAKPVQLAAKTSSFKTMMEAKFAAADKVKKEIEEKELADRLAAQRMAEEKMKEELRLKAVVAHLPTESRAAKERRLKAEAEEKAKVDAKARKEKVFKATSLGHRRNGGGKSRGRYAAEVDQKVITERRAERRKEAAMKRKMELGMDSRLRVLVPSVMKFEKSVIVEKVSENEARMAWMEAGKDSEEFNMIEATKLLEVEEERAEAEAMAEVVGMVAGRIIQDKTTKMERIIAEQAAAAVIEKEKAEKKAERDSWTEVRRSVKKSVPMVLKMGQVSHRETMRKQTPVKVDTRTVAHEKLSDKKEIEKTLTKTRMCKSVEMGTVCRHGVRCRFAHTLEELVVAPCVFGVECRRVECVGGCYKNCGERVCNFIHPNEERDAFYLRTGLKKPTPVKASPVKASPVKASPVKASPVKAPRGWDMSKLNVPGQGWTRAKPKVVSEKVVPVCESVVKGIPCRHGVRCRFSHPTPKAEVPPKEVPPKEVPPKADEEIVLRVPKEMFVQAMEMAVKSGKTNIRVEIIDS